MLTEIYAAWPRNLLDTLKTKEALKILIYMHWLADQRDDNYSHSARLERVTRRRRAKFAHQSQREADYI